MIASDPPGKLTRTDFLAGLKASGLEAMPAVRHALSACAGRTITPEEMARTMVDSGALTRFQADRLLAGKTDGFVIGRYVVLDLIGVGPVARVYRARHTAMDRLVALKVLAASATRDPDRRTAFQAEVRAAAVLAHPNIVTILDVNQTGRRLFVVMEYVDGTGVDAQVRQSGPLTIARACEVVRQVALGVQHAHDKGIRHGAIYPGCVLVGPAVLKVTGFGLGRLTDPASTSAETATDPLDYRAPELFNPLGRATAASDVYSLGCLLTYLLTGRPPFPYGSAVDRARQHIAAVPPGVEFARPDVPPALTRLIRMMLAKDPLARPTCQDVVAFLERIDETEDTISDVELCSHLDEPTTGDFLSGLHGQPSDDAFPWSEIGHPTVDDAASVTATTIRHTRPRNSGRISLLVVAVSFLSGLALIAVLLLKHLK